MLKLPLVDINKLVQVIQNCYLAQVVQYSLGTSKKNEKDGAKESDASTAGNKVSNNVGLFPPKGKEQVGLFPLNSSPRNHNKSSEHLRDFNMDQSVEEINEQGHTSHPTSMMSAEDAEQDTSSLRERHRYDVNDRRYRYDGYFNKSDGNCGDQLTPSKMMEAKIFLDKIAYVVR